MMMKFGENELKEECLSNEKFLDLIIDNLTKNQKAIKEKANWVSHPLSWP